MKERVLSLAVVLALLVTACAQATQPPAGETEAPPAPERPQATEEAAPPEEAGPPEEVARRQLRIAHAYPIRIDPAIGGDFASSTAMTNIYDTLLFPTPEGDLIPWVAESWDVSDDGLTYTFRLRQGIKFHDGSELQASDVVFSMNRILTIGQGFGYLFTGRVADVEAVDDYTVEFTLNAPYALFPYTLLRLWILNEDEVMANAQDGEYGEFGDYGTTYLQTHDAGSGPYKVVEFRQEEFLLLEKNDDWWGEFKPGAPTEVRIVPNPEPATLRTLMANRELEISDQWQSADTFRAVDEIEGVDIAAYDAVTMLYLYLNTKKPPLDDVHVRRALSYAFDYETAAELDWPGTQPSRGPVPASLAGFNPNLTPYRRDLDKAREELAQSAYADNIDQFPIVFHWVAEVPDEEKIALLFQSNMAEIGIPVEIVKTPWLTMTELFTTVDTTPHVVPIYVNSDIPEAGALLFQRYHSSTTGTFFQGEWLQDEFFDARIEEALATLDKDQRFAIYYELQEYLMDLAPSIFVYDQLEKHAYQTYLDWPAAQGTVYPVMGYNQFAPMIEVKGP